MQQQQYHQMFRANNTEWVEVGEFVMGLVTLLIKHFCVSVCWFVVKKTDEKKNLKKKKWRQNENNKQIDFHI